MAGENLRAVGDRIESLLADLHATADPRAYAMTEELVRLVTELYGAGLARVVELAGEDTPATLERLAGDELVASLLLVHGLHPESLATRVERALESVRPFLAQHAGDVELVDVDARVGAVRLRLLGSCDGCPSSAVTLRLSVEQAVLDAAPEVTVIDVDEPASDRGTGAVPVTLGRKPSFDQCPTGVEVAAE